MTSADYERLGNQLIQHEGLKLRPYKCSLGYLTIGVGYNIDARGLEPLIAAIKRDVTLEELYKKGLTEEEARKLLAVDILVFTQQIRAKFPLFDKLDPIRQMVVVDFVFNLGLIGAAGFKTAIRFLKLALQQTDPELKEACFTAVAFSMANSLWAQQVDDGLGRKYGRADRLAYMMRTGQLSPK